MVRPYKPLDRSAAHDTWFCYVPAKRHVLQPESTQEDTGTILSFNDSMPSKDEPLHQGGKRGLRLAEQDKSLYMRHVLAGGRQNLLKWRKESEGKPKPVSYHIPEWYGTHIQEEKEEGQIDDSDSAGKVEYELGPPEWFCHDDYDPESSSAKPRILKRPIIGWDALSAWKREEQESPKLGNWKKLREKNKEEKKKKRLEEYREKKKSEVPRLPKIVEVSRNDERSENFGGWYKKWYISSTNNCCK